MSQKLPTPEVVRRFVEESFHRSTPVLALRWHPASVAETERLWELPEGVSVVGPAPPRFGFHLQRVGADAYAVRLLWDRTCLSWPSLTRVQLLSCSLAPLLSALGTDLWYLLDQPVQAGRYAVNYAA